MYHITLSVHFCVQHDGRDIAHFAGLTAITDPLVFRDEQLHKPVLFKTVNNLTVAYYLSSTVHRVIFLLGNC